MSLLRAALLAMLALSSPALAGPSARADLVTLDIAAAPWSAIGRINNSAYGRCSAILVDSRTALTAAHCLYNIRAKRFLQAPSIHVLFGFDRGRYGFHATVSRIVVPDGYEPATPAASAPHDWAVLHLAEPVPDAFAPLALADKPPTPDAEIKAAGFAQERSEVLTASPACRITGMAAEGLLLADCRLSHGFSGGPLIDMGTRQIVGMGIAITKIGGTEVSLAIPAARLREALAEK